MVASVQIHTKLHTFTIYRFFYLFIRIPDIVTYYFYGYSVKYFFGWFGIIIGYFSVQKIYSLLLQKSPGTTQGLIKRKQCRYLSFSACSILRTKDLLTSPHHICTRHHTCRFTVVRFKPCHTAYQGVYLVHAK